MSASCAVFCRYQGGICNWSYTFGDSIDITGPSDWGSLSAECRAGQEVYQGMQTGHGAAQLGNSLTAVFARVVHLDLNVLRLV